MSGAGGKGGPGAGQLRLPQGGSGPTSTSSVPAASLTPSPSLRSRPGAVHSAKNILEDISNMFDDLADQLDAMLD